MSATAGSSSGSNDPPRGTRMKTSSYSSSFPGIPTDTSSSHSYSAASAAVHLALLLSRLCYYIYLKGDMLAFGALCLRWLKRPADDPRTVEDFEEEVRRTWDGFRGKLPPMRVLEFMAKLVSGWTPEQLLGLPKAVLVALGLECEKDDEPLMEPSATSGPTKANFDGCRRFVAWLSKHADRKVYMVGFDIFGPCIGPFLIAQFEWESQGVARTNKLSPQAWLIRMEGLWNAVSLDLCRRKYGIRIVVLPSSSIAQQGLGFIDIGAPLPTSLDITSSDLLPGIWGIGVPHLQLMATAHCEDWRFINSASLVFAILRLVTIDTSFDNHVSFVSALRVFLGCYGKLGMSGAAFATFSIGLSSDLEILYNLGRPSGVPEMVILQIALERLAAKTGAYKRMAVTPTQKAAKTTLTCGGKSL